MLSALLMIMISAVPQNDAEKRYPESTEVYRCQFDASTDKDFDTWPDGWTRQRGPGFPGYTKIRIVAEKTPSAETCLRIDLDGGGAAIFSPPIPLNLIYGYVLETQLRTVGLKYDRAFLSLTLLDADKHTLEDFRSESVVETDGWKKIRLGPTVTSNPEAKWAVIGLHVEPQEDADLQGQVSFSDVWLGRLPRLEMKSSHPQNFFVLPEKPQITCIASGLDGRYSEAAFEVFNIAGDCLASETRPLAPQSAVAETKDDKKKTAASASANYTAVWTPPLPGPGFYRFRLALKGSDETADRRELTLAVVESCPLPSDGIFGWSLPQGAHPLPLPALTDLIQQAGISWVKYPLWCSEQDGGRQIEELIDFAEKLNRAGISLAGLLLEPPPPLREKFPATSRLKASDIFCANPQIWYPSLEPVIIQLSNKVRYWQLGRDTDLSLLVVPNFYEKLKSIRAELERGMQGIQLGIGWDARQSLPIGIDALDLPWNFVSVSSEPPLNHGELAEFLDASVASPLKSWVVLAPLPRGEFPLPVRAENLARRMVAAKIHGAAAAFCPDPFDPKYGLMNPDGTPGELFMTWRTTALAVGGAQYLGEMILPSGSPNMIFLRSNDALMFLWNDHPTEEILHLGEHIRQTDLWGLSSETLEIDGEQLLKVGRTPTFISGIAKPIAEWSIDLKLATSRIQNVFGQALSDSFTVKNTFPGPVVGKLEIVAPPGWIADPRESIVRLQAGERLTRNFKLNLPATTNTGRNTIRFDFEIQHDQKIHKFSVYRYIEVGSGEIHIEMQTKLNERKELEVVQRFVNESDKIVNFRCELYAPDRRQLSTTVLKRDRGVDVQVYRLEDGDQLLGKTLWLRAEELDGARILNYRFKANE